MEVFFFETSQTVCVYDVMVRFFAMAFLYRDRLSASDYLKVRKVCEHVYEKLFFGEDLSGNGSRSEEDSSSRSERAEEKIEILCQDQVVSLYYT